MRRTRAPAWRWWPPAHPDAQAAAPRSSGLGGELRWGPDPKAKRGERSRWFAALRGRGGPARRRPALRPASRATWWPGSGRTRRRSPPRWTSSRPTPATSRSAGRCSTRWWSATPTPAPTSSPTRSPQGAAAGAFDLLQELSGGDRPTEPIVVQATLSRQYRGIAAAQARGPEASADDVAAAAGLRAIPRRRPAEQARALPPGAGARGGGPTRRARARPTRLRVLASSGAPATTAGGSCSRLAVRDLLAGARRGPAPR